MRGRAQVPRARGRTARRLQPPAMPAGLPIWLRARGPMPGWAPHGEGTLLQRALRRGHAAQRHAARRPRPPPRHATDALVQPGCTGLTSNAALQHHRMRQLTDSARLTGRGASRTSTRWALKIHPVGSCRPLLLGGARSSSADPGAVAQLGWPVDCTRSQAARCPPQPRGHTQSLEFDSRTANECSPPRKRPRAQAAPRQRLSSDEVGF